MVLTHNPFFDGVLVELTMAKQGIVHLGDVFQSLTSQN
ncbi:hypothetical protein SPWS13_3712 [Shewanella putrefaciens]|nr:hypothetical protein SPWS13_3712 [Shewanella putrefaciens]